MRFIFLILSLDLIMSSSNDHENKEEGQDQAFILQSIQQHSTRLEIRMNGMRYRIEKNEEVMR